MNGLTPVHRYRVRVPDPAQLTDTLARAEVCVDLVGKTVTTTLPGHPPITVDVVTARALSMLLWHAVFGSLEPSGPELRIEKDSGDDAAATRVPR